MKILIVGFSKIKYMPYMNFYLENIDIQRNDVHVLYWNRDLKKEDVSFLAGITLHEFSCKQEDDISKFSKIGSFLKFRKYVKKMLKQEKFDFLIILHSLPGVLIYDVLQRKYKNRYIFDYRDSTYERFIPFKRVIGNLVKNSSATFVSSDAFRRFLPESEKYKIFTSHNLLMDSLAHRKEKKDFGTISDKIRIAFWGFIRHEEVNRILIKRISADDRFELHYYGREQRVALNLKAYVKEIEAENVFFHGEYKPEDRYEFVRHTDIIHNVYKDPNMMLAMANKYYDAVIFYVPLVSICGSFMAETAKKAGIGFEIDLNEENCLDKLFDEYDNFEKKQFYENCDRELERVLLEYNYGVQLIKKITGAERTEE